MTHPGAESAPQSGAVPHGAGASPASGATTDGRRPATVTAAYWLWIVPSILTIIAALVLLLGGVVIATGAVGESTTESETIGGVAIGAGVFVLVVAVVIIAIAVKMRRGANWARITLTVLGVMAVVTQLTQSVQAPDGGAVVTIGVSVGFGAILYIIAIVLMWLPVSNAYFSSQHRGQPALG